MHRVLSILGLFCILGLADGSICDARITSYAIDVAERKPQCDYIDYGHSYAEICPADCVEAFYKKATPDQRKANQEKVQREIEKEKNIRAIWNFCIALLIFFMFGILIQ